MLATLLPPVSRLTSHCPKRHICIRQETLHIVDSDQVPIHTSQSLIVVHTALFNTDPSQCHGVSYCNKPILRCQIQNLTLTIRISCEYSEISRTKDLNRARRMSG